MSVLESLLINLQNQGIFELYLPFLLTFAIFFALLEKSKVFGKDASKINALIAFIAGFYIMIYSPLGVSIGNFFSMFFAETSVLLVTLLVFLMVIALLMGPFLSEPEGWERLGKKVVPLVVVLGLLLAFGIFGSSGGFDLFRTGGLGGGSFGINLSSDDIVLIILLVGTILVIIWLVGGSGGPKLEDLKFKIGK